MALTFDTGKAIRKLRERGMEQDLAEATVEVVTEATDEVVTKEYLDLRLRSEINRSVVITAGVVIAGMGVIITLVQIFGG